MKKILSLCLILSLGIISLFAYSNLVDTSKQENSTRKSANSSLAEEEFRRGVQSYYRGAYNEAIFEFEKALSYLPGENLILDWLGKSYYKSGIEGAALLQWNYARENNYGGLLLQNRIEIVNDRRIIGSDYTFDQNYAEVGSFLCTRDENLIFSHPMSVLPNSDGSFWICAYGSNELVCFDVNGTVINRSRGPINGFDRPSDIIRLKDGNILVCESAGDRLSLLDSKGHFIKYFGSKGCSEGQFLGPQYMAQDSFGNIYVSDFGNSRITVLDSAGNGLLHFGGKTNDFKGLKSPTGIAIVNDRVFVADSVYDCIFEFDRFGNYISTLVREKTFLKPESLKNHGDYLILTDSNRVISINIDDGSFYENARSGRIKSLITSAVPDLNGNLIVTDFKANEIYIMSKMSELVGGFYVQIERVIADNFPNVIVEARVENRKRQQVIGLQQENFLITEGKRPVSNFKLLGAANNNDVVDLIFLVDRKLSMKKYEEQINSAIREISTSMKGKGTVSIISVGEIPVLEFKGSPDKLKNFNIKSLQTAYSKEVKLDLGIRLATNNLINAEKKRGIIYLSDGEVSVTAFEKYGLSDMTAYLNNNSIFLSLLMLNNSSPCKEINFLVSSTAGKSYYVYRPEGLKSIIDDYLKIPSGLYQLQYTSALTTEYGRKYLPIEIETYLLNRSGRDESGYFAPLE